MTHFRGVIPDKSTLPNYILPYTTWEDIKTNKMPGSPPESTILIAQTPNLKQAPLPEQWREFCIAILCKDDRLYIRFLGKPKVKPQTEDILSFEKGSILCIDWRYPNAEFTCAKPNSNIHFLTYNFQICIKSSKFQQVPTVFYISVSAKDWLKWLPCCRRIAVQLTFLEIFQKDLIPTQTRSVYLLKDTSVVKRDLFPKQDIGYSLTGMLQFLRDLRRLQQLPSTTFVNPIGLILPQVSEPENVQRCSIITEEIPAVQATPLQTLLQTQLSDSFKLKLALNIAKAMLTLHHVGDLPDPMFGNMDRSLDSDENPIPIKLYHRDLNFDNILVKQDASVLICKTGETLLKLRPLFSVCSTSPLTAAPEIDTDDESVELGTKLDVYSFSIILWSILSNKLPFPNMTDLQIRQHVKSGQRPPIGSSPLQSLISTCWSQDPKDRPEFDFIVKTIEQIK